MGRSNLGVNLGGCPVHGQTHGIAAIGWNLTHEVPWFGWQQPRGEPRRMPRARADTRHCGDRVESNARDPVVWVAATSGWTSEDASCTGSTSRTRAILRWKCSESREKAMILWVKKWVKMVKLFDFYVILWYFEKGLIRSLWVDLGHRWFFCEKYSLSPLRW